MKRTFTAVALGLCLLANASAKPGDSQALGERDWSAIKGMTAGPNGKLYVASLLHIWAVDKTGKGQPLLPTPKPKDWGRSWRIAAVDNKLYCINEDALYEIDAKGATRMINNDFGAAAMVGLNGKLYTVSGEKLGEVNTSNGEIKNLGGDWYNTSGIAASNGMIYIMSRDQIYAVNPADGKSQKLEGTYNAPTAMTAFNGKLYVFAHQRTDGKRGTFNEARIYEVDPASGKSTEMPLPKGFALTDSAITFAPLDGKLYMVVPAFSSNVKLFSLSLQ